MQIKEFYLDLKEGPQYGKKNRDVWVLESEAFKEPLKFKFGFDDKDKRDIQEIEERCKSYYEKLLQKEKDIEELLKKIEKDQTIMKAYDDMLCKYEDLIGEYEDRFQKESEEQKAINKGFTEALFKQDQKLVDLKEEINQPKSEKIFYYTQELLVTGDEIHYGEEIKIPSGNYLIIEKKEFTPMNEYVGLDDIELLRFKMQFLDGSYIPEAQIRSSNGVDKPVCKIKFDILFFQI